MSVDQEITYHNGAGADRGGDWFNRCICTCRRAHVSGLLDHAGHNGSVRLNLDIWVCDCCGGINGSGVSSVCVWTRGERCWLGSNNGNGPVELDRDCWHLIGARGWADGYNWCRDGSNWRLSNIDSAGGLRRHYRRIYKQWSGEN